MNKAGFWTNIAVILLAIVSVVLTTKLLAIRNHWLTELEKRQKTLSDSAAQLATVRTSVNLAEAEVQSLVHDWGEIYPGPNSGPVGQGVYQINTIGPGAKENAQGKPLPFIYPFLVDNQGSMFLGEFKVEQVQPDNIIARLTRDLMPKEMDSWSQGLVRTRTNLPASWRSIITELNGDYIVAQDLLRAQNLQLQTLTGQIQDSQQVLDRRLAQLSGNPNALEGAAKQVLDGLVQTLRELDVERSQLLGEVDSLRVKLDTKYVELMETLENNKQLAEQLKQSGSEGGQPRAAQAALQLNN